MISRQSCLQTSFSYLIHKCDLVSLKWPICHKNVNLIQFKEENVVHLWVHVNHLCYLKFPAFEKKIPGDCSSLVDPKRIVKLQFAKSNLRNSSQYSWKFSEIFGNIGIMFGNSDIFHRVKISRLCRKSVRYMKVRMAKCCVYWG